MIKPSSIMRESQRQPKNVLIRVDQESDTDSIESFSGGSGGRRTTSTSGDKAVDGPKAGYRGPTFEDILPPQFISNAPPPAVEPKHGIVRHSKPAKADGPPAASEPVTRSYPSAKRSDSKSGGGGSRIRNTARALARGLSIMKKRDSQGYEAVR
ncbi:hypothetical protein EI94DRAFT_1741589 [Lactarius quietus]|nr:hypothetical protein EI94DRAFT_1741589 [Lactarius quietus]